MKEIFVINEKAIFSPDDYTLSDIQGTVPPVMLHVPSSECLYLLLQHNNEVLSQKFLFEEVWEKNGSVVTANTLYQNIALLRKAFKTVGLSEEVIRTIPRQGIKFSAHVHVLPKSAHQTAPDENSAIINETVQENVNAPPADNVPVISPKPAVRVQASWKTSVVLPAALCVFFLALLVKLLYSSQRESQDFFAAYSAVGVINNCQLYSSFSGESIAKAKFKRIAQASALTCQRGDIVYLTYNRQYDVDSLIRCDKPIMDNSAHCQSIIYRELTNETE